MSEPETKPIKKVAIWAGAVVVVVAGLTATSRVITTSADYIEVPKKQVQFEKRLVGFEKTINKILRIVEAAHPEAAGK